MRLVVSPFLVEVVDLEVLLPVSETLMCLSSTLPRRTRFVADYTVSVKLLGLYLCDIVVCKILNTQNDAFLCYPNPRESSHTIFVLS